MKITNRITNQKIIHESCINNNITIDLAKLRNKIIVRKKII